VDFIGTAGSLFKGATRLNINIILYFKHTVSIPFAVPHGSYSAKTES
jgi:hypothetical protein